MSPPTGEINTLSYVQGLYTQEDVTPYIHALVCHVPAQIERYGGIGRFSTEMLEKLNHLQNHYYFAHTQKKGAALLEIMRKESRNVYYGFFDGCVQPRKIARVKIRKSPQRKRRIQ